MKEQFQCLRICFRAVVSQSYRTNVFEVSVLSGNAGILKCEIPSFVTDFVHVTGWFEETAGANFYHQNFMGTLNLLQLETVYLQISR